MYAVANYGIAVPVVAFILVQRASRRFDGSLLQQCRRMGVVQLDILFAHRSRQCKIVHSDRLPQHTASNHVADNIHYIKQRQRIDNYANCRLGLRIQEHRTIAPRRGGGLVIYRAAWISLPKWGIATFSHKFGL